MGKDLNNGQWIWFEISGFELLELSRESSGLELMIK